MLDSEMIKRICDLCNNEAVGWHRVGFDKNLQYDGLLCSFYVQDDGCFNCL